MISEGGLSDELVLEGAATEPVGYPQPDDVEGGDGAKEPATAPPQPGALSVALTKAGITPAIDSCSNAVGNFFTDGKGALAAKWEADPNFRKACMGVGAVLLVLGKCTTRGPHRNSIPGDVSESLRV